MAIPYSKGQQLFNNRKGKKTQRMRGDISPSVRQQVKERSKGICEIGGLCHGSPAVQMCHLQSRNTIEHTTAADLLHGCVPCHLWMDTTAEGIKYKRNLRYDRNT